MGQISIKFGAKIAKKFLKIDARTALSSGAIWDEFGKQHLKQGIKKALNLMLNYHFFGANKVRI